MESNNFGELFTFSDLIRWHSIHPNYNEQKQRLKRESPKREVVHANFSLVQELKRNKRK